MYLLHPIPVPLPLAPLRAARPHSQPPHICCGMTMVSEGTLEGLKLCAMPLEPGLLTWGRGGRRGRRKEYPGQSWSVSRSGRKNKRTRGADLGPTCACAECKGGGGDRKEMVREGSRKETPHERLVEPEGNGGSTEFKFLQGHTSEWDISLR